MSIRWQIPRHAYTIYTFIHSICSVHFKYNKSISHFYWVSTQRVLYKNHTYAHITAPTCTIQSFRLWISCPNEYRLHLPYSNALNVNMCASYIVNLSQINNSDTYRSRFSFCGVTNTELTVRFTPRRYMNWTNWLAFVMDFKFVQFGKISIWKLAFAHDFLWTNPTENNGFYFIIWLENLH